MRVISYGFLLLSGLASASAAPREDFCAVTLHVVGADGAPITSTWIELDDPSGKTVRKEMMMGPTLRICDFGFGPHTLRVGTNECLPVAISNLRVVLGSPVDLNVRLDLCGYREIVRSGCLLYFRVVDDGGHPVPNVSISPGSPTDVYGRHQDILSGKRDFTFSKDGFASATVSAQCSGDEEIDKSVVLRRLGAKILP